MTNQTFEPSLTLSSSGYYQDGFFIRAICLNDHPISIPGGWLVWAEQGAAHSGRFERMNNAIAELEFNSIEAVMSRNIELRIKLWDRLRPFQARTGR